MRRERLFGNRLVRLAASVALAFVCVGYAWGEGSTIPKPRLNPAFVKWQYEQKNPKPQVNKSVATNQQKRTRRLLTSTSGENTELLPLPEGIVPTMIDFSYLNSLNSIDVRSVSGVLSTSYDPRNKGLTPVRHQDPQDTGIGTCWAQASIGSMETWLKLNGYGLNQFSVKNMVNREGWDSNSWYGGNFIRSSAYLLRWDGPVWESDDPYTNKNGIVNYSLSSPALPAAYHVQQTRLVPARTGALDNNALKNAILAFGGLYATMKLYTPYYQDTSILIPYWNNTGAYYCPETGAGHAVTLIGWDDNYSMDNFNPNCRPKGNGAWIIKDSYGEALPRDNGYIYVSYYDTTFAYAASCAFPLIEGNDNYGYVYQYDEFGQVIEWGIPANSTQVYTSGYGANMFTATQAEELAAVGFYATIPKATYKIRIYTGCNASKPSSGTLALEQSGTVDDYAGFYTIPLKNTITVGKDSRFSVVLFLSTPGAAPFSLEIAVDSYISNATANAGESFFSPDGSNWYDFNSNANLTYGIPANLCCKAYTKSATVAKPVLSSLAITGVSSLTAGQSVAFTCEATYSDGSKKAVTPTWSITEGRNYATISSAGLVTAKSVTAQQRVTVKASYTEDGVRKEATWGFYVTIAAPSAPTGVTATQGAETSCVRVNWAAPSGATEYAVYRAMANSSKNAQYLENVTATRYNDTSAVPGVDYWYFVKAKNSSGTSGFSAGANGWRKLSPPENVIASDTLLDKVALEWSDVEGANYYRVYRATSIDGAKSALGGWQTDTTFNDTMATAGVTCYYFVVAAVDASGNRPSDYSIVEDGMRAEPVRVASLSISGAASIASGGNATYTATVTYTDGTSKSVSPTWSLTAGVAYATISGAKVTAKTVTENQSVTLKASYSEDGQTVTSTKQVAITAVAPAAPTGLTLVSQTASGIALRWDSSAGAMSYRIYRAIGNGEASSVGSASATSFTDSTAVPGVAYAYSISAVNGAGESARSATVSGTVPLAVPAGVTATSDRTDGVLVSWKSVNGATHYRVARATSASGAKTELGSWQTETSYKDTSATAGTKYWYFVRAATYSSGANASAYSASAQGVRKVAVTLSYIAISGPDKVDSSGSAVYSCTAVYSDGTTTIVSPTWSVLPVALASVDSMGRLTAQTVSSDTSIILTASYSEDNLTKEASKDVSIVAPGLTSASVSDVKVHSRWPFSGMIDVDYFLKTEPEGTGAKIVLSAFDVDHGRVLFPKTLSGDGADGSVMPGMHRITWNVGADYKGIHISNIEMNVEVEAMQNSRVIYHIENGVLTEVELNGETNIVLPEEVHTVKQRVFQGKPITAVMISRSVRNIEPYAFQNCSSLTNVIIHSGEEDVVVDRLAFYGCSSLKNIKIQDRPVAVRISAFSGCSSLETVIWEIGSHALSIERSGFPTSAYINAMPINMVEYEFDGLRIVSDSYGVGYASPEEVIFKPQSQGAVYTPIWRDVSIPLELHENGCAWTIKDGMLVNVELNGNTEIRIPDAVTIIANDVFKGERDLSSVTMSDNITIIGKSAFSGCSALQRIVFSKKLKSLMSYAFDGCEKLRSVALPDSLSSISPHSFFDSGIEEVFVPSSVTKIGIWAFGWCPNLQSVILSDGVEDIGDFAFTLSSLNEVVIPNSVTNIGRGAFSFMSALKSVQVLGKLSDYDVDIYATGSSNVITYVTENWTGPIDTWCGRPVVVMSTNVLSPKCLSAEMNGGNVEYAYVLGQRMPVRITTTVNLTWDKVGGATSYSIWKSSTNNPAAAACVATVDDNSCSLTEVLEMNSSTMYYWVKAIGASSESDFSNAASVTWNWRSAL